MRNAIRENRPPARLVFRIALTAALLFLGFGLPAKAYGGYAKQNLSSFPWKHEMLEFTVSYSEAPAIHAVIQTGSQRQSKYGPYIPVSAKARSVGFFEKMYPIRDTSDTFVHPSRFIPLYAKKVFDEYAGKRTYKVAYHHADKDAFVRKRAKNKHYKFLHPIPSGTHDMVSWLYELRTKPQSLGQVHSAYVYDGWALSRVDFKVVKKEEVYTELGWFKTWRLDFKRHILQSPDDLDKKSSTVEAADLSVKKTAKHTGQLWLSRDENHLPVKLSMGTKFGKINVHLTDYTPGQRADEPPRTAQN